MNWIYYPLFVLATAIFWMAGILLIYGSKRKVFLKTWGNVSCGIGIAWLLAFIIILWFQLERPPLKTLGETRLWYSLFLLIIGYLTYVRWALKWILNLVFVLSATFMIINLLHPETYDKTLMSALQSPWFIPHVIVYIFAYALLGLAWGMAIFGLFQYYRKAFLPTLMYVVDQLVTIGFSFLTLGLLFGALWAKRAWGNYWTWDPKETWAFLTWMVYLVYIHIRYFHPAKIQIHLRILSLIFIFLLLCWFGINYMPSAQNSVHVYTN